MAQIASVPPNEEPHAADRGPTRHIGMSDADVLVQALADCIRPVMRDVVRDMFSEEQHRGPRSYTVAQTVEATSLSRSTLSRMEARGELRVVRVGRRVIVPADEVERLIADGGGHQ